VDRYDGPNTYTITLWNLETGGEWEEVDIVIDERLASAADGNAPRTPPHCILTHGSCAAYAARDAAGTGLLGCSPSLDGELWVCYLEKALAIHCGGWDAIDGGFCTHGWRLLTGCREQYYSYPHPSPDPNALLAAAHRLPGAVQDKSSHGSHCVACTLPIR
jgi:hypothetical protein